MTDGLDAAVTSDVSKITYLKDYQPPAFLIETTDLSFDLQADKTIVHSRLAIRNNPDSVSNMLELDGDGLQLQSIAIDGRPLDESAYQ
jgi:aminopeptidase N